MKKRLSTRIQKKLEKLKLLKIQDNHKDRYKLNTLLTEYDLMLQLLTDNDEINIEKFHNILEEKRKNAEALISKWNIQP